MSQGAQFASTAQIFGNVDINPPRERSLSIAFTAPEGLAIVLGLATGLLHVSLGEFDKPNRKFCQDKPTGGSHALRVAVPRIAPPDTSRASLSSTTQ